jgi:hypothetical protein
MMTWGTPILGNHHLLRKSKRRWPRLEFHQKWGITS